MKSRALAFAISAGMALLLCVGFVLGTVDSRAPAYRYLSVFAEVLGLVRGNYVDPVEDQTLLRGAYQGMLMGLDPYSAYLTAEEYARVAKEPEGPAVTGLEVLKDGTAFVVVAVWPGSPAARAGLEVGDRIWSVDGVSTREMSLMQARRRLSGGEGSEVTLQTYRARQERKRQQVVLKRATLKAPALESRIESGEVAYLRIRDLSRADRAVVAGALAEMVRGGARRLLVDLRGCTRGSAEDAVRLAGLFLGDAPALRVKPRSGAEIERLASGPAAWTRPAWLLVNGGTAGAAEGLAAALHEGARAPLLGETTYGLGAQQELIRLPQGDGLVLSVARYLSPGGRSWYGEGLSVDEQVPSADEGSAGDRPDAGPGADEGADDDPQLRRALEIVRRGGERAAEAA